ncbi:DUF4382 domain-containing protein [Gemmatimonadota bacterium DH-20]|uniref:DUF4382 domain-containing protein n=1 Tax=Gaopeijia maritima TaxID=3119007 RepID=A0ABU9E8B5_9BACT
MTSKSLFSFTALATASLLAMGCGDDDPVAVDDTGVVTATLVDSPDTPSSSNGVVDARRFDQVQAAFDGTFRGTTLVEIYSPADEQWFAVTGTSTTQLALGSSDWAELGSSSMIEAGSYTRVRLTITGGEAVIEAGATLGGVQIGADVTLALGGSQDVVIEKDVAFTVQANATTDLVIDLNSEMWVTEENVDEEEVTEDEMEEAARVDAN